MSHDQIAAVLVGTHALVGLVAAVMGYRGSVRRARARLGRVGSRVAELL